MSRLFRCESQCLTELGCRLSSVLEILRSCANDADTCLSGTGAATSRMLWVFPLIIEYLQSVVWRHRLSSVLVNTLVLPLGKKGLRNYIFNYIAWTPKWNHLKVK